MSRKPPGTMRRLSTLISPEMAALVAKQKKFGGAPAPVPSKLDDGFRAALAGHPQLPELVSELDAWYEHARKIGTEMSLLDGINREQYLNVCLTIYRVLHHASGGMDEEAEAEAAEAAAEDWRDASGGALTLPRDRFQDALFELAYQWAPAPASGRDMLPDDYSNFLHSLRVRLNHPEVPLRSYPAVPTPAHICMGRHSLHQS